MIFYSAKIIKMEIWRRNVRRRIELGPSRSLINSPNYNFNDVICSVIPEYGNFLKRLRDKLHILCVLY